MVFFFLSFGFCEVALHERLHQLCTSVSICRSQWVPLHMCCVKSLVATNITVLVLDNLYKHTSVYKYKL